MHADGKTRPDVPPSARPLVLVLAAVVLGAIVLVVGMLEEPYHIDELRQVQSYSRSVPDLIELSFGQEQPPLDPILGKIVRRVVGEGHIQQRLHPTLLGIGALVLLASLLWRAGFLFGSAVTVLVYSIVPVVVGVTAYARQYALPVFLALAFLVGAEEWLKVRSRLGLATAVGSAVLLPLSRSVEPIIFLGAVAAALMLWSVRDLGPRRAAPVSPLVGSAIGALLVVGVPILLRFRSEASEFIAPPRGLGDRVVRLATDLPPALAETAGAWPIAALVLVLCLSSGGVRRFLRTRWWFWPLAAIPFGFASAFFLLANADQPFFLRYAYSWWLPFAVLVGVLADEVINSSRAGDRSVRMVATAGSIALLVVVLGYALARDLSRDDWVDYEPLGIAIQMQVNPDAVVYFDNLVPLGDYRAGYAGRGRFLPFDRAIPSAPAVVRNPLVVRPDSGFVVAVSGPRLDVAGWTATETSPSMYLYLPDRPVSGLEAAGSALVDFGRATSPEDGAMLRLAGASLLHAAGDQQAACGEVVDLIGDAPDLEAEISEFIRGHPIADLFEVCVAGA